MCQDLLTEPVISQVHLQASGGVPKLPQGQTPHFYLEAHVLLIILIIL